MPDSAEWVATPANGELKRGATSRAKRVAQRSCASRGVPDVPVCRMMWMNPAPTKSCSRRGTVSGDPTICEPRAHLRPDLERTPKPARRDYSYAREVARMIELVAIVVPCAITATPSSPPTAAAPSRSAVDGARRGSS